MVIPMQSKRIYLAGGMSNLSQEEQGNWRYEVSKRIEDGNSYYGYEYEPDVFNPIVYYNMFEEVHKSDKEHFEFDLHNLRNSDLVIVNFNEPKSIGTAMELAVAHENRIPVVGLNEDGKELHPWLKESVLRMCDNMDELIEHIALYYLS